MDPSNEMNSSKQRAIYFIVVCGFLRKIPCFIKKHAQRNITVGFNLGHQGIQGFKKAW